MKVARFYAPRDVRLEDIDEPTPGPDEVKIRVRNCSTCGTDVKISKFGHHHIHPPRVMGHEIAGEIVDVGEGVAIPHGTLGGKELVKRDALAVLRFPDGIDWGGEQVTVCVAIAAAGDGHVELLAALAEILLDEDQARELREATEPETVTRLLGSIQEEAKQ